jgi:hypothetical protein
LFCKFDDSARRGLGHELRSLCAMLAQDVFTCSSKCCKRESLFRFILNRGQPVLKTPAGLVGRARLPHLGNEGLRQNTWRAPSLRSLPCLVVQILVSLTT